MIKPIKQYIAVEMISSVKAKVIALPYTGDYSRVSFEFTEGDTVVIRPDAEVIKIKDDSFIKYSDIIGIVEPY